MSEQTTHLMKTWRDRALTAEAEIERLAIAPPSLADECEVLIDRVSRLLCERHQYVNPTRLPCAACTQEATAACVIPPAMPATPDAGDASEEVERDLWRGYLCPALANIGALKEAQRKFMALGTDWAEAADILSGVQSFYVGAAHSAARRYVADVAARESAARAEERDEGKHSEHTPARRFGDGDCICANPYRSREG